MLTTTHILLGAAVSTRPHYKPWQITLGWLGGFAPDASVFMMVAATRMGDTTGPNMWRKPDGLYWQEPWQTLSAISNSIPLWVVLALLGFFITRNSSRFRELGIGLMAFGIAALVHVLCDFPVHTDDAHVHFWPFTDWRFHSPVSYYQSAHYGDQFRVFEMQLNGALIVYLVARFKRWPIRILAVLLGAAPFAMRAVVTNFF